MRHRAATPRHSHSTGEHSRRGRRSRVALTSLLACLALAIALAPAELAGAPESASQTDLQSASQYRPWWAEWFSSPRITAREGRAVDAHPGKNRLGRPTPGKASSSAPPPTADSSAGNVTGGTTPQAPSSTPDADEDPGTGAATPDTDTTAAGDQPAASTPRPSGGSGGGSSEGILLSRAELMALPTSGPAWAAIMARVQQPYGGSYTLGTRDDANKDVLAHALAGARLDNAGYKQFVRDKIERIISGPRNSGDLLATLRQLQTYVISADLVDLASFDPALDARFRPWLAAEVRFSYSGGGGGGSVISNHDKKPNNYGTHAGSTRIAAAIYLGDDTELQAARDVWYGWATGDPAYSHPTRKWTGTTWQCDPNRPAGINGASCSRDGHSLDGVIPEDQVRCGEYSWGPCATNYIHGATDGMTLSFWMLDRQGEDPWTWGNQAALRQMQWKFANGQAPYSGFRWQIPVIESAYGVDLPGNAPTATSTNFGFADWWAQ